MEKNERPGKSSEPRGLGHLEHLNLWGVLLERKLAVPLSHLSGNLMHSHLLVRY